jgi:hypothetical protein
LPRCNPRQSLRRHKSVPLERRPSDRLAARRSPEARGGPTADDTASVGTDWSAARPVGRQRRWRAVRAPATVRLPSWVRRTAQPSEVRPSAAAAVPARASAGAALRPPSSASAASGAAWARADDVSRSASSAVPGAPGALPGQGTRVQSETSRAVIHAHRLPRYPSGRTADVDGVTLLMIEFVVAWIMLSSAPGPCGGARSRAGGHSRLPWPRCGASRRAEYRPARR